MTFLLTPLARRLRSWADGVLEQEGAPDEGAPPSPAFPAASNARPETAPAAGPPAHWLERIAAAPSADWVEYRHEAPPQQPRASEQRERVPKTEPVRKKPVAPAFRLQQPRPERAAPPEWNVVRSADVSAPELSYPPGASAPREAAAAYSVDRARKAGKDLRYGRPETRKVLKPDPEETGSAGRHDMKEQIESGPAAAPPARAPLDTVGAVSDRPHFIDSRKNGRSLASQRDALLWTAPAAPRPAGVFPMHVFSERLLLQVEKRTPGAGVNGPRPVDAAPAAEVRRPQSRDKGQPSQEQWSPGSPRRELTDFPAESLANQWPDLPETPSTSHEELEEAIRRLTRHWALDREQGGRSWSE